MTQPAPTPEGARPSAGGSSSGELQSAATRPCPACGSPASINATICPTCGESLPSRNKRIRCRRCGGTASAALVVCPHCGRELQAAPPRWLTWGAPLVLVALFGLVLLTQLGGASPVAWTQRQTQRAASLVASIGDRLQPDLSITTLPVEQDGVDELVSQPALPQEVAAADDFRGDSVTAPDDSGEAANAAALTETLAAAVEPAASAEIVEPAASVEVAASTEVMGAALPTATATTTASPTVEPTATEIPPTNTVAPSPTATLTPQATSTARATSSSPPSLRTAASGTITATAAVSTATAVSAATKVALTLPTPTPLVLAPTPTPNVYRIRPGDTLFEIALGNDISLETLLAANDMTEDDVYTIQPGDDIVIPDPNATVAPAATATATSAPTPSGFIYTVQPGDTLMAIGLRFGVNVQQILDANGLSLAQARTLRTGQELIIPGEGEAPTSTPQPTATTARPTAPPTSIAQTGAIRLDAPTLRTPENNTSVQCGAGEQLVWNPVPFIQPNDLYIVHLGYVNGRDASNAEEIVWVLAQQRASNVTLWQLDDTLCGLAPFEFGRQWRWYVDVAEKAADGTLTPVSPSSDMWGFAWQ